MIPRRLTSPSPGARVLHLALPVLLVGCSSEPTTFPAPPSVGGSFASPRVVETSAPHPSPGFYPLVVGNSWHYSRIFTLDYHGLGSDTIRTSTDVVNLGTESRSGRTYFVEEETSTQDSRPGEVFKSWSRFRQDQWGLYYPDVCLCEPPTLDQTGAQLAFSTVSSEATVSWNLRDRLARRVPPEDILAFDRSFEALNRRLARMREAVSLSFRSRGSNRPGGADVGEVTLLPYPLHVGKTWQIRPDMELYWTVEGFEMLETPAGKFPAWRIRVSLSGDGPEDYARIWYGRSGRLAYRIHVVVSEGYPGAGWTGDESEVVDWLSISH